MPTVYKKVRLQDLGYHLDINGPESYDQVVRILPTVQEALKAKMLDDLDHFKVFYAGQPLHVSVSTVSTKGKVRKHKNVYMNFEAGGEAKAIEDGLNKIPELAAKLKRPIEKSIAAVVRVAVIYYIAIKDESVEQQISTKELYETAKQNALNKPVSDPDASS